MAFDVNNLVIDRILKGIAVDLTSGDIMFSITQIENPSLKCASEETDVKDALGTTIMSLDRSKSAEFTAESALFDLGLLAAQMGTTKKVATAEAKITTPKFETITITTGMTTYALSETPKAAITAIYGLNSDSSLGTKYTVNTAASATQFAYATGTITLPTGLTVGSEIFVMYEYDADAAVSVDNSGTSFAKSCKFILEALCADVCNPNTLLYAYVVFPNAKISSNVDVALTSEGKHSFSLKALQSYCDSQKRLFSIIVPEA